MLENMAMNETPSLNEKAYGRFVSGRAEYVDDIELPRMAYCSFIGSPYAHARIRSIDVSKALKVPGVLAVLTGKDLVEMTNPLLSLNRPSGVGLRCDVWRTPKAYSLALDRARFYGEPVAAIIAERPHLALDAAQLVNVEYEPLPPVTSVLDAMEPSSPRLYDDWDDNIQLHLNFNFGDVDAAFKEADRIINVSWRENRVSGFPIESRGCVASYDKNSETLNLWSSTQHPFLFQQALANLLRMPASSITVRTPDIGGAFGNKANWWKDVVVCVASIVTGRPVKWFESKTEFIVTGPHQRDVIWQGKVAIKNDGTVLGLKARFITDLGIEGTTRGTGAASVVPASYTVPNAYKLKGLEIDAFGVVTNKSFYGAYRGYGKDKGVKFMERVMDLTSTACNMKPEEVRFKNFIQSDEFPYKTISGYVYDSGDYSRLLKECLKMADVDSVREKQKELRKEGRYVGVGIAFAIEPAGLAAVKSYVTEPTATSAPNTPYSGLTHARIRITSVGTVQVFCDWVELGQGSMVTATKVVSDILGVRIDDVSIRTTSEAIGSGPSGSRGVVYSLGAIVKTARELKSRLVRLACAFLNEKPANVYIKDSVIYSIHSERTMTFKELAQRVYGHGERGDLPERLEEHELVLDVSTSWYSPNTTLNPTSRYATYCSSADVSVVEVDIETGVVSALKHCHAHDAGKIINEEVVRGQLHGGVVQGIGEALREELVYDKNGILLSNSYTDFVLPTMLDVPEISTVTIEIPSPYTDLGQKGMGESPIMGSKVAVINAINDALSPLGVTIEEAPATMERVRKKILQNTQERNR